MTGTNNNPVCCGVQMRASNSPYDADGNPIKGHPWFCVKCGVYRERGEPEKKTEPAPDKEWSRGSYRGIPFPYSQPWPTVATGECLDRIAAACGVQRRHASSPSLRTDEELRQELLSRMGEGEP